MDKHVNLGVDWETDRFIRRREFANRAQGEDSVYFHKKIIRKHSVIKSAAAAAKAKFRIDSCWDENARQSKNVVNGLLIWANKYSICKFRGIRKTGGWTVVAVIPESIGTTTAADPRMIRQQNENIL